MLVWIIFDSLGIAVLDLGIEKELALSGMSCTSPSG
jgi:hypothetical protein